MRRRWFLFGCLAVSIAVVCRADVLYLKDGSTIRGKLFKVVADSLYFKTSFGSKIRIHRDKVSRIDFTDDIAPIVSPPSSGAAPVDHANAEPGTLIVAFDKVKFTSRIEIHRDQDRAGHERANAIEQQLRVNGEPVFTYVDTTTDKEVREGPKRILRNDIELGEIKVGLPPGTHHCQVLVGNTRAGKYQDAFVDKPLDYKVTAGNVLIRPGETTVLRIGKKRGKLGLGGAQLYVIE